VIFMEKYKLTVAFCATNETKALYDAYSKIREYDFADEYVFVLSETATDGCVKTVNCICDDSDCRYVFQKAPGLGNAIREAIVEAKGSHIIIWPADDGMDTKSFPEMVRLSKENPEKIVSVSRWLEKNGFDGYGALRKAVNFVSQKLFAFIYKSSLTDFTNPTQIAPIKFYKRINWQGQGWDLIPELIFKPLKSGCEFIEVPCKNFSRKEGKSNSSFFKLAPYYLIILKIYFMPVDEIIKEE